MLISLFFLAPLIALIDAGFFEGAASPNGELLEWDSISVKYKNRSILQISTPGSIVSGRLLGVLGPSG
jgi:hypothetical protein